MNSHIKAQVDHIERLLETYDCELVSYGLAPNPNGFCFERGENTTDLEAKLLSEALGSLSKEAENYLREHYL